MFGSKFDRRILTGSEFFCFNFNRKQLAAFELVSYGFVSWNEIPRKRKHSVVTFFAKLQQIVEGKTVRLDKVQVWLLEIDLKINSPLLRVQVPLLGFKKQTIF